MAQLPLLVLRELDPVQTPPGHAKPILPNQPKPSSHSPAYLRTGALSDRTPHALRDAAAIAWRALIVAAAYCPFVAISTRSACVAGRRSVGASAAPRSWRSSRRWRSGSCSSLWASRSSCRSHSSSSSARSSHWSAHSSPARPPYSSLWRAMG